MNDLVQPLNKLSQRQRSGTFPRMKLSDAIRWAILNSGIPRYRICKHTGINPGTMSRFLHGRANLSLASLDKLYGALGWRLVARRLKQLK